MLIPARILRQHAMDVDPTLRHLTPREEAREERILKTAIHLITRFGVAAISFTNLAIGIKIAPSTLRKHFADFDALLGEIMRRHLQIISQALAAVPCDAPDRPRRQRAAYIEATRCLGAPTATHLILTNYRANLPDDERETVNAIREQIGLELAGADGEACLHLLDCPGYDIDQIERMLIAAFCHEQPAPVAHSEAALPDLADLQTLKHEINLACINLTESPGGPLCHDAPGKSPTWDATQAQRLLSDAVRRLQVNAQAPPVAA
jgi:AcrR family transcriptional regulator